MRMLGYLCLCPFANSFATIQGSYNTVLQQIPTKPRTIYSHDSKAVMARAHGWGRGCFNDCLFPISLVTEPMNFAGSRTKRFRSRESEQKINLHEIYCMVVLSRRISRTLP